MLVCGRCGHHNTDNARFCASCDTYLDFSTSRKVSGDPAAPQGAAPSPPQRPEPPAEPAQRHDRREAPPAGPAGGRGAQPGAQPGGWPPRQGPASSASHATDPDLFGGGDDYGTLLDDLAALGYGPSDRASAAAAVVHDDAPTWPGGAQDQPQQPYREPAPQWAPDRQSRTQQPVQAYQASPAEAVLPQAVQPQQPRPAPPPDPEPDAGIHAVLPAERQQQSVARTTAPEEAQQAPAALRPGEVACPRCGRPNPREQRFCRCGHQFAVAVRAQPAPVAAVTRQAPPPWWRRLLGQARGARHGPTGNLRVQYSRALEVRTQIVRGLLLLGALGVGVSLIGPWGIRSWAADQFANLTQRYATIKVTGAAVFPEQPEQEGFAPRFATDGETSRAWAVGWNAKAVAVVDEPCSRVEGPAAGALAVTFERPARVDRITVRSGLDREEQKELASKQASPKTVDVLFSDGTCERLDLKNDFSKQRFTVKVGEVEGAVVNIVDAYPAVDGPGNVVAISDIAFESRR